MSFAPDRIYFAFASGRFGYDCIACGAKCCRGFGYSVGMSDAARSHIALRPSLRFFNDQSVSIGTVGNSIRNCPPACFFLDHEGLCGVQTAYGHEAKPETCRLFPFNSFRTVGGYLIAAPHASLCPLAVTPAPARSEMSNHEMLFAAYATAGIEADVPHARALGGSAEVLVRLERKIVAMSERESRASDYSGFVGDQLAATMAAIAPGAWIEHAALAKVEVDELQSRILEVLGVPRAVRGVDHTPVARVLSAATPFLRSTLVFPDPGITATESLDRVPRILLALYWLAVLAMDAGMATITFQTVSRLLGDHLRLLTLLSYLDAPVGWRTDHLIDLSFEGGRDWHRRYLTVVKSLSATDQERKPLFGDVLADVLPLDDFERICFLRQLAKRLAGKIGTPSDAVRGSATFRPRQVLQKWAIRRLDLDHLVGYAEHAKQAQASSTLV